MLDQLPPLRDHEGLPTSYFDGPLTTEQLEQLTQTELGTAWVKRGRLTVAWVPSCIRGTRDLNSSQERASMLLHTHPINLGLRPGAKPRQDGTGFILDKAASKRSQEAGLVALISATTNLELQRAAEKLLEAAPYQVTPEEKVMELAAHGLSYEEVAAYQRAMCAAAGSDLIEVRGISRELSGLVRAILMPEGISHVRLVSSLDAFNSGSQLEVIHFHSFIA